MDNELNSILKALIWPFIFSILMVLIHLFLSANANYIHYFAVLPLNISGLKGVVLTVFAHKDWEHLISNLIPFLLFAWAMFYYYRPFAWKAIFLIWILTGFWVWLFARQNYHIGASGLVYGLASFHVLSGILRREFRLMAFAMLVVFLYGGLIWGFFPELFPNRSISWESHLMGTIAGIIVAFYYRKSGIQKLDPFADDDDFEDEDSEGNGIVINYLYNDENSD